MVNDFAKVSSYELVQREFFANVYKWMSLGLFLTAAMAYIVSISSGLTHAIVGNKLVFYGLIIAELAMVWYFSARINKISVLSSTLLFLGYSALNGLTLSVIFLVYTASSIASTFLISSGTFALTSLYGYVTKKDLSKVGSLCFMGLIGIIVASVVNMFMHNSIMETVISYIGVLIFVGLTAYDTQKIRQSVTSSDMNSDENIKGSIKGALVLYLDFINLFIFLLRILGNKRS